ncbi:hypothetical protein [Chitinophaga sp. Ak27]|uniref:hypothetical protein n=1 Tax=Chitinophaga sp. Ak27 TaxID=2726116 RepID=UPI00145F3154|nr:hypothetical protein [Chitinophaga sp. Ak27]NLU92026.1 hypothetical protein [Chitinophaga sp. Ak27]
MESKTRKEKWCFRWNTFAKTAAMLLIGVFGTLAVSAQTLPPLKPAQTAPVLTTFEREYNYGYQEGERFASRKDRANYQWFLAKYYEGLNMYPEDADFYQGRIQGLTYGWLENQPEADFSTYEKLLKSLQRNSAEK